MTPEHGDQNVDRRRLDPGGQPPQARLPSTQRPAGLAVRRRHAARPRRRAAPPRRARGDRGRRRARRHDGASARSHARRRNAPPPRAPAHGGLCIIIVFFPAPGRGRCCDDGPRYRSACARARPGRRRSAPAVRSSPPAAPSTTSSLSLWGRRDPAGPAAGRQPVRFVGALRLIPRGPRDAEAGGGMAHRHTVLAHAAQHLVPDLDQVARVEERVRQKSSSRTVSACGFRQPCSLRERVFASAGRLAIARAPSRKECKYIDAHPSHRIKPALLLYRRNRLKYRALWRIIAASSALGCPGCATHGQKRSYTCGKISLDSLRPAVGLPRSATIPVQAGQQCPQREQIRHTKRRPARPHPHKRILGSNAGPGSPYAAQRPVISRVLHPLHPHHRLDLH